MKEIFLISEMVDWKQDFLKDLYGQDVYAFTRKGEVLHFKGKHMSDNVYYTYLKKETVG